MTDLHTLLSEIQSATGPDRELDARIWCAINDAYYIRDRGPQSEWARASGGITHRRGADGNPSVRAFTSSLDAIEAATRERFPNGEWLVRTDKQRGFANIQPVSLPSDIDRWIDGEATFPEYAATPELAFCAALIAAVIGEKK